MIASHKLRPDAITFVEWPSVGEEQIATLGRIAARMSEVGLRLHPVKTRIVYCKDDRRRGEHEHTSFTFLGYACFPGGTPSTTPPSSAPTPPLGVPPAAPNPADPLAALRARCVQRSNEFRAQLALPPLAAEPHREACLDSEAQADAASGTAHGAFGRCQEGARVEPFRF